MAVLAILALGLAAPARAADQPAKERTGLDQELGGADLCPQVKGIVKSADGSAPFYAGELHTTSCKKTSAQYEKLSLDLATCLGNDNPKIKRTDDPLSAKFLVDKIQVRAVLKKAADSCEITLFIEK